VGVCGALNLLMMHHFSIDEIMVQLLHSSIYGGLLKYEMHNEMKGLLAG
jgi:hypothetical protein